MNEEPKESEKTDSVGEAMEELARVVARLRAPDGCPWDREQDHDSLRYHAVEEVYELLEAIEENDDTDMEEELGDLLLQVALHCQIAEERGAFDLAKVARRLTAKLIHRHPHVFGDRTVKGSAGVLTQWDRLKQEEKAREGRGRQSVFDGVPHALPALLRAEKVWKRARRAGLLPDKEPQAAPAWSRRVEGEPRAEQVAQWLFEAAAWCRSRGLCAEDLLRRRIQELEEQWRGIEAKRVKDRPPSADSEA